MTFSGEATPGVLKLLLSALAAMMVLLIGALFTLIGILYNNTTSQIGDLQKAVNGLQIQSVADNRLLQTQMNDLNMRIQDVKTRTENFMNALGKQQRKD